MRRAQLPELELGICRRLRQAREEYLEITHRACAEQLGIPRTTIINYELGKAPVRCEIALRFCRQFVVNEEWLATGRFTITSHVAAQLQRMPPDTIWSSPALVKILIRNCADLHSEPEARSVPPNALFSEAFTRWLAPVYARLAPDCFYAPRVVFRDSDESTLIKNYFTVLLQQWLALLQNRAREIGKSEGRVSRTLLRCLYQAGNVIFTRLLGQPTPEIGSAEMHWFRVLANSPDVPIGPLFDVVEASANPVASSIVLSTSGKLHLTQADAAFTSPAMPSLAQLRNRLKAATARHGARSALAVEFGVSRQAVSQWISGATAPEAATTLKLLQWVERAEAKQRQSAGSAATPPAPKTQTKVAPAKAKKEKRK